MRKFSRDPPKGRMPEQQLHGSTKEEYVMDIRIPRDAVEKIHKVICDNVDEKYKDLVDPSGFDALKERVKDSPALQKYFEI